MSNLVNFLAKLYIKSEADIIYLNENENVMSWGGIVKLFLSWSLSKNPKTVRLPDSVLKSIGLGIEENVLSLLCSATVLQCYCVTVPNISKQTRAGKPTFLHFLQCTN